jgi:voltage-gated potassium channel
MVATSNIMDRLSKPVAVAGLALVTVLTIPSLPGSISFLFLLGLAAIWLVFLVELGLNLTKARGNLAHLASIRFLIDTSAVVVPALGPALGLSAMGCTLLCSTWALKLLVSSTAVQLVARVLTNEGNTLLGVFSLFLIILFSAAVLAFALEGGTQPDTFGNVPKAMWWAIVTLTTTGYGDAVPQTLGGRLLAGVVMTCGIGVFALGASVLAIGFAEELRRRDFIRNWQLVTKVPVFSHLSPADLIEITRALKPRNVSPGSLICRKGGVADQMYFILQGTVGVDLSPPVALSDGQFFGEMALITGEPRVASVSAVSEVSLLTLHASDFQILMAKSPEVAAAVRTIAEERRRGLTATPN